MRVRRCLRSGASPPPHHARQASRLNRIHPGKEDTFVLDFVNETEEIQRSFQPYYERTTAAAAEQIYERARGAEAKG